MDAREFVVWGPELSPFLLKLEAMLAAAQLPFRRQPRDGTRLANVRAAMLVDGAKRAGRVVKPGGLDPLDEFPLVPFLVTPAREVLYDTSALAAWIDGRLPPTAGPLVPRGGSVGFAARFLDEAFDEFGLYMVHHNRWKLAAGRNGRPGLRLAREYARFLPPGVAPFFARWFERRQVRRLPYLFSVAPEGYRVAGLEPAMTPPSRPGFPPTHDLLEETWRRTLAAMEALLATQPWILGGRFTVADASAYGQLSMNLTDDAAADEMRRLAPRTFAWLEAIRDRRGLDRTGGPPLSQEALALVAVFCDTFAPLMRANAEAWQRATDAGRTASARAFNEAGFDAGLNLFDCTLRGHACRSVVKTFQVASWRALEREWAALGEAERHELGPLGEAMDASRAGIPT